MPTARRRASHDVALAAPARAPPPARRQRWSTSGRMRVTARALGRGVFADDVAAVRLEVTSACTGAELHRAVAARADAGTEGARDLVVTHRGALVEATSESVVEGLEDGGAVLVAARRTQPTKTETTTRRRRAVARGHSREDEEEDDDADLIVPLEGARAVMEAFMTTRLGAPRWLANGLARAPAARILAWFLALRAMHARELGPLFILGTGFALVVTNLGHRRAGELSAYSVFNAGVRRLPGQFTADDVDDAIMRRR